MLRKWVNYHRHRARLRSYLAELHATRLLPTKDYELFAVGKDADHVAAIQSDVERAELARVMRWVSTDFRCRPRFGSLKIIIILAPRESDFGNIAKCLDMTDAERFAGLYTPRYRVVLAMGEAGTEALVATLVHEATHAFAHAGYGAAGMLWAIEGYAELLKRRHSVENGIQGAAEQYSAFLTMHAQGRALSVDHVISVTESTHARLDEVGCFCFEVFATALTAYLLDVRTTNTALHRLWRRAIVKGFPSADAFARAVSRSTGLSLPQLETAVIARLERLRSDTGDAEIGWTEDIRVRRRP